MRLVGTIIGVIVFLLGLLWIAQGSNLMPNTPMSGQNQWFYAGIAGVLIGLVIVWWARRSRS